jgi:hypothetical protein
VTELMWRPSTPSSASARVHQRPPEQDIELFMSGSLLGIGLLGRNQFKEALTSFPPHHAALKTANAPRRQSQPALTTLICEGPEKPCFDVRMSPSRPLAGPSSNACEWRFRQASKPQ